MISLPFGSNEGETRWMMGLDHHSLKCRGGAAQPMYADSVNRHGLMPDLKMHLERHTVSLLTTTCCS